MDNIRIKPNQEVYLNEQTFEQDVLDFSKMPLSFWKDMRDNWHKNHSIGVDALIDGDKEYSHEELLSFLDHPIFNAYGYSEFAHKNYVIDSHINSNDRPWMKFIKSKYAQGSRILDFGCGDLTNAICFYDMGYNTTVVDAPADWIKFIEYRCKKYGINIDFRYSKTNDTFLKDDEQFDVIFSHEVLEHVKNPDKVLKYLVDHLKICGLLFVSVTFTTGAFHLKENHERFGYGPEGNVHHHPEWMKVINSLNLISIGNDFYIKGK